MIVFSISEITSGLKIVTETAPNLSPVCYTCYTGRDVAALCVFTCENCPKHFIHPNVRGNSF